MLKKALVLGLVAAAMAALSAPLRSQEKSAASQPGATQPAGGEAKTYDFDSNEALAGWTITGDVTIDLTKGREGKGGALKVGPAGKALLKLRDRDESGKVDIWVYDDGTKAAEPNVHRAGPRWGLVQSDGRVVAVGALYAPYLSGAITYAASDSDGKNFTRVVTYLGLNRAPAGWHKWTFNMDPDKGLTILHNDKDVNTPKARYDWNKSTLKGFSSLAIWGDSGKGGEQTIWVDDVSVTLGGPMKAVPAGPPPPASKPAATK